MLAIELGGVRSIGSGHGRWRRWRDRIGREVRDALQRAGVTATLLVRFEATPGAADEPPLPAAFSIERWRADDPALPADVPGSGAPTDVLIGATFEGDLVGYCVLCPREVSVAELGSAVEPGSVSCWDLYVKPAYRGRGDRNGTPRPRPIPPDGRKSGTDRGTRRAGQPPISTGVSGRGFEPTERVFALAWGDRVYRRRRAFNTPGDDVP